MAANGALLAILSLLSLARPLPYSDIAFRIVPRQERSDSCGYAVLAGTISLAGFENDLEAAPSEESLWRRYAMANGRASPLKASLNMAELSLILEDYGISSTPIRLDPRNIPELLSMYGPAILHLCHPTGHFVLGFSCKEDRIIVADPEWGLHDMGADELSRRSSGAVLLTSITNDSLNLNTSIRDCLDTFTARMDSETSMVKGRGFSNQKARFEAGIRLRKLTEPEFGGRIDFLHGSIFWAFDINTIFSLKLSARWKAYREGSIAPVLSIAPGISHIIAESAGKTTTAGFFADIACMPDCIVAPGLRISHSRILDPHVLSIGLSIKPSFALKRGIQGTSMPIETYMDIDFGMITLMNPHVAWHFNVRQSMTSCEIFSMNTVFEAGIMVMSKGKSLYLGMGATYLEDRLRPDGIDLEVGF
jgi:hypothetical protein